MKAQSRFLTLRGQKPSSRQKYAAMCALEKSFDVQVRWEEDPSLGNRTKLYWMDDEVASWVNHPLVTEGDEGVLSLGWSVWQRNQGLSVRLMLPGFSDESHSDSHSTTLPFDPLAATFYGLTCWDEQRGVPELDKHGRPTTEHLPWIGAKGKANVGQFEISMAKQHHWPWIEVMWNAILFEVKVPGKVLSFRPTFDVDVAFKHLGRPAWKSWSLQARDLVFGRWTLVSERSRTLRGKQKDPYDTYSWIRALHSEESIGWFVLAADRKAPNDVGLDPNLEVLPALVETLAAEKDSVGWHPSYAAVEDMRVSRKEKDRFQSWHGGNAQEVRTHFLRGTPGSWWRHAVSLGIKTDASLGWSRDVGFRAGFSQPYPAYDLKTESSLPLLIHPIAVMDIAMRDGMGWSALEAKAHLRDMMHVVSKVGGTWMSCWHNTSVSEQLEWLGWQATYLDMVDTARRLGKCNFDAWKSQK